MMMMRCCVVGVCVLMFFSLFNGLIGHFEVMDVIVKSIIRISFERGRSEIISKKKEMKRHIFIKHSSNKQCHLMLEIIHNNLLEVSNSWLARNLMFHH